MAVTEADASRLAASLVLRLDDLPGPRWRAVPAPDEGRPAPGEVLDEVLDRLEVLGGADSPRFVRPPAGLAYSTAAVLAGPAGAGAAFARAADPAFADAFADAVLRDVEVSPGGAEPLGVTTRPTGVPHGIAAAAHRMTFAGATHDAVVAVHVDLVALAAGPALVLAWLGESPDPFPAAERDHVVRRLAARLASFDRSRPA